MILMCVFCVWLILVGADDALVANIIAAAKEADASSG